MNIDNKKELELIQEFQATGSVGNKLVTVLWGLLQRIKELEKAKQ